MRTVPFVNLERQLSELNDILLSAVRDVIESRDFIQGSFVSEFEREFANAHGAVYAIGCSSGTSAIFLILKALGIGPGDEVIVPSHTFFSTASSICHVGATPIFADIEPKAYTVSVQSIADKITAKTRAILPVHIYGSPCLMNDIATIAANVNAYVIEDSAQAHLARYKGRYVGSWGQATAFSFYPGKNLGAFGDAGLITTSDENVAVAVRQLRDHGRSSKYLHEKLGYNFRMDGLQAAILSVKLRRLESWNDHRRRAAKRYDQALVPEGFKVIEPHKDSTPAYHLYVVEVSNRDEVQAELKKAGISTGIHYPVSLHRQPAFEQFAGPQLPQSEAIVERILSLPICGQVVPDDQDYVIEHFLKTARP